MIKNLHLRILACVVFFTMNAAAQTPSKSDHPLLDKYYPDLNRKKDTLPAPAAFPSVKTTAPTVGASKSVVSPATVVAPKVQNEIVESVPPTSKDTTNIQPTLKASTSLPSASTIAQQKVPVVNIPPQQKVQPPLISRPEGEIYRPTRLGSSSPLYDTYDKNKKGAGSVTTSPKG
ncbi:MAG: hypothetical protein JSS98_13405 [Bacteroidetes bacterium]|nr:hypothetical protein [Bacteroidota bacterium]